MGLCFRCNEYCNGVLQWGREIAFNSEYQEKWEFIAKEHRGRSVRGKLLRGNILGKGCGREDSGEMKLTGFLMKAGQADQTSPG